MDWLELFRLAREYYQTAANNCNNSLDATQTRELHTLLKTSLLCLNKILAQKAAINTHLRVHSLFLKCQIISDFGAIEYDENNELVRPEYLYDQAIMISSAHESFLGLRLEAEVRLIRLNVKNRREKLALKLISSSIFAQTSLFKYLHCFILSKIDEPRALYSLQLLIKDNQIDPDPEIVNLFMLMESNLAYSIGAVSIVNLGLIQTNFQPFVIFRALLDILYQLNLNQPMNQGDQIVDTLQLKLKSFAELISNHRQLTDSFQMTFSVFERFTIPLDIEWINYESLYSIFLLIYAVSNLNTSFEKRKSLQLLSKNISSIDESLERWKHQGSALKMNTVSRLNDIKKQTQFYKLMEYAITVGFNDELEFQKVYSEMDDTTPYRSYILAMKLQMSNKPEEAKATYLQILSNFRNEQYQEISTLASMNALLIIEAQLQYNSSAKQVADLTSVRTLMSEKAALTSNLECFGQPKSLFPHRFLMKSTHDFIRLLTHHEDLSTLQVNEQVSNLIDPLFDYFKNYPLFASMLLYLKSSTLNENSDQKQKSSQLAFNLSKFGNQLLIRYVTGLLNQQNSNIARNIQQYDIQTAKNKKIKLEVLERYTGYAE